MRSYTLVRVWGIPIKVDTSLLVFLPILAWLIANGGQIELYSGVIEAMTGSGFDLAQLQAGSTPWLIGIVAAVGLFVSVTIHELGHSWVALRYGIEIESITLWILGGLASLKTLPKEWNREFWIAIAGPLTSVLVAAVCVVGTVLLPDSSQVWRFIVGWLAITNLILAVFNLLPAFPMDGGRILRALLARSRPYGTATKLAARIGVAFALLFAGIGVWTLQILLLLLALFIYSAATTESQSVLLDELLEGLTVGDIMTRDPASISADTTIDELGMQMVRDRQTAYPVADEQGTILGMISLADLKQVRGGDRATRQVGDILQDTHRVDATADAFDTLALLSQAGAMNALVTEDGSVTGVLTETDYARAMTNRRGFDGGIVQ